MITLGKLSMQFLCFNSPHLAPLTTSDMFGLLKNWEWNGNPHIKYLISYEILIFIIDKPIDRAHGTEMPPILFLISGKLNMA
jgi:hypothetical protein